MNSNRNDRETEEVRVELKYCEHCGALWIREGGAGVYCAQCQAKVADFPVAKKRQRRTNLPISPRTLLDEMKGEAGGERIAVFVAAGGAE